MTGRLEDGDLTAPGGGYKDVSWVAAKQDDQATLRLETAAARAAATIRLEVEEGSDVNNLTPVPSKEGPVGTPLELPFSVVKDKKYWITISAEPGAKCSYSLQQSSGTFSTAIQWRGGAPTAWPLRGILTRSDYTVDASMLDIYRFTALETSEVTLRVESRADGPLQGDGLVFVDVYLGQDLYRTWSVMQDYEPIGEPFTLSFSVERGQTYFIYIEAETPLTYTIWQEPTVLSTPQLYQWTFTSGSARSWPIRDALNSSDHVIYDGWYNNYVDYYVCTAIHSGQVSLTLETVGDGGSVYFSVGETSSDFRHFTIVAHSDTTAGTTETLSFTVEQGKKYIIEVSADEPIASYVVHQNPTLLSNASPTQMRSWKPKVEP